jgi:hypothetical protein
MDLLSSLGDVTEFLKLGIHHSLGYVVLPKSLRKLLPCDVGGVRVCLTETVPLGTSKDENGTEIF